MGYERRFEDAIDRLKAEGRYRIFANLERDASRFPMAMWRPAGEEAHPREVTVVFERLSRHGRPPGCDRGFGSGGAVFFIDGDKACTPMAVPDELLAMMDAVTTAKISHEGSAL
jgi:hypothetical protein